MFVGHFFGRQLNQEKNIYKDYLIPGEPHKTMVDINKKCNTLLSDPEKIPNKFNRIDPRITKLMMTAICLMAAACALAGAIIIISKRGCRTVAANIPNEGPSPYQQADSLIAGYPPRPRNLFILQERKQQALGCKPKLKVVRLIDLIKENEEMYNDLHDILKPGQAVVLRRCIDEESYCPGVNKTCVPADGIHTKRIIIHVYNATVGAFVPISRHVAEYTVCVCQDCLPSPSLRDKVKPWWMLAERLD